MSLDRVKELQRVTDDLPDASDEDCTLVLSVYETLLSMNDDSSAHLKMACASTMSDYFVIRIASGINKFSDRDFVRIRKLSTRIRDVMLNPERGFIMITIWYASSNKKTLSGFEPVEPRKHLTKTLKWSDETVPDADDRQVIANICSDMYNMRDRMPPMLVWLESSKLNGNAAHTHVLCFAHAPCVSASVLEYLRRHYTAHVVEAYFYQKPPLDVSAVPLIVVIVRSSRATDDHDSHKRARIEGGIMTQAKKRKKLA